MKFIPKQPCMVQVSENYYKYISDLHGISHFYSFKSRYDVCEFDTSVPDTCIDFNVNYSDDKTDCQALICGTRSVPDNMECQADHNYFGVRFLPGFVPGFLDISYKETIDSDIAFEDISSALELPEMIMRADSFEEQIEIFTDFYKSTFIDSMSSRQQLIDYIINEIIENYGRMTVGELSAKTGYSVSYLDKIFREYMGISPKRFSSIIRFQWLLKGMTQNDCRDKEYIIQSLGYFDQAHMIHDFKRFAKKSPGQYMMELAETKYVDKINLLKI